jgi:hypothetical protein
VRGGLPFGVVGRGRAGLLAVAIVGACATAVAGCGSSASLPVSVVARRVEEIRGLRLSGLPRIHVVGQAALLGVVDRLLPPRLVGPAASDSWQRSRRGKSL